MPPKLRILIISHILPYPKTSGQSMRLYYTLMALKKDFHIIFLISEAFLYHYDGEKQDIMKYCDELILLPATYKKGYFKHSLIKFLGFVNSFFSGLKFSNFLIGNFEFSTNRIMEATKDRNFDLVLFEYWHANKSASGFKNRGIPCVLDMHNVLLQSYISQYNWSLPTFLKNYHIKKYQLTEVNSWKIFDAIIAINNNELDYVRQNVPSGIKLFYIAMGIDMSIWPYVWQPAKPQRFAYYGGMGANHNKQNALFCVKFIMPLVWKKYPETEFWIIGSDPDDELRSMEKDLRIHVIGYQENVQDSLQSISILLCPWKGRYGFRSRIIEVMATGIPVICSKDAVDGMELKEGWGLFFAENENEFANQAIDLLNDETFLKNQSKLARIHVEEMYSFENTYQSGVDEIQRWVLNR